MAAPSFPNGNMLPGSKSTRPGPVCGARVRNPFFHQAFQARVYRS